MASKYRVYPGSLSTATLQKKRYSSRRLPQNSRRYWVAPYSRNRSWIYLKGSLAVGICLSAGSFVSVGLSWGRGAHATGGSQTAGITPFVLVDGLGTKREPSFIGPRAMAEAPDHRPSSNVFRNSGIDFPDTATSGMATTQANIINALSITVGGDCKDTRASFRPHALPCSSPQSRTGHRRTSYDTDDWQLRATPIGAMRVYSGQALTAALVDFRSSAS